MSAKSVKAVGFVPVPEGTIVRSFGRAAATEPLVTLAANGQARFNSLAREYFKGARTCAIQVNVAKRAVKFVAPKAGLQTWHISYPNKEDVKVCMISLGALLRHTWGKLPAEAIYSFDPETGILVFEHGKPVQRRVKKSDNQAGSAGSEEEEDVDVEEEEERDAV